MPELPEIEHLRRSLEPVLLGRRVVSVKLHRRDMLRSTDATGPTANRSLLAGRTIVELRRHGKNLALVADDGRALCIHLGMSGQLTASKELKDLPTHVHCVWRLRPSDGRQGPSSHLVFRDPRRFGGLFAYRSTKDLEVARWSHLGPDALTINATELHGRLAKTSRAIKAALLDQAVIAGVGNIYADEALFAAGINPQAPAAHLKHESVMRLAESITKVLQLAVEAGGSTLRDYVDGLGNAGRFARSHQVYGRGHQPCFRCGNRLQQVCIAQRTTVCCPVCQPLASRS